MYPEGELLVLVWARTLEVGACSHNHVCSSETVGPCAKMFSGDGDFPVEAGVSPNSQQDT